MAAAEPAKMDPPGPKYDFRETEKLIRTTMDMEKWEHSETYYDIMGFINSICFCIQGKGQSSKYEISPIIKKILNVLDKMEKLAIETPPVDQPQRYGNSAFRTWHQKMSDVCECS